MSVKSISTHILDTSAGRPAQGVEVILERSQGDSWVLVGRGQTDNDGRFKDFFEDRKEFVVGNYRITFLIDPYFKKSGIDCFYPHATIDFKVQDCEQHYHVPLLLNPFGYSTYRGS